MNALRALAAAWRAEAEHDERRGLRAPGRYYAEALDEAITAYATEELTIAEAARETGLAEDTLYRQVGGRLPNAGRKGAPRVRRCDLFPGLFPDSIRGIRTCPVPEPTGHGVERGRRGARTCPERGGPSRPNHEGGRQ